MKTFTWLLRRELWEHRALWIAPAVVGGIMVLTLLWAGGVAISVGDINDFQYGVADWSRLDSDGRAVITQFTVWGMAMPFGITLFIMLLFYCMDALYADRRDRSMLFWKSLPISDTSTVLSKLATALLVAPLITFGFVVALHLLSLVIMSITGLVAGMPEGWHLMWHPGHLLFAWASLANALLVEVLILLPIFAWFLLASAWAKKGVFLWAFAPPLLVIWLEWWVFDTTHFAGWIGDRFAALFHAGFNSVEHVQINHPSELGRMRDAIDIQWFWEVFGTGMFWTGVIVAAAMLAGAVWLRRWRDES